MLGKVIPNILYYLKRTTTNDPRTSEHPSVLINLDSKIMNQEGGRFSYLICQYFEKAGFKVIVNTNLFFFLILHPYKKLLLGKNYLLTRKMKTPLNSIVSKQNGKEQVISVTRGLETLDKPSVGYSLPYPMHPVQVDGFNKAALQNLRETKKPIKLLFSGTWTGDQYKVSLGKYNVLTRDEVIRSIIDKFRNKNILRLISDRNELNSLIESQRVNDQIIISEVKTRDEDWMKLLSLTDFFIAPPGFMYPWCHNSIEAMAVGAIPVLQYNNLFVPELVHMENCICFQNKNELEVAINTALTLSADEIARLRRNVIDYYDTYLSPEAIVKKIQGISAGNESKVEMALPYIS